jgi:hypothetical protein
VEQFSDIEQLELLIPWDLPLETTVSNSDKIKLIKSLKLILKASVSSSYQEELKFIERALLVLGKVAVYPVEIKKTQTSLDAWEVQDYDKYFGVNHIKTKHSAIALVRSLLITYEIFIKLIIQNNNLESQQIEIQKKGFTNYVYLLTRVFDLSLEENNE